MKKAAKAPYQPVEFSDSDDDTTTTKATVPQKQKTAAAAAAVAVPPQQTKNLFDSDEDEADDNLNNKKSAAGAGKSSLSINKAYANRYDQVKRTKELQQLTAKYGDRTLKQKSTKQDDDEDNYEFSSSSASENDVSSEDETTMERKLKGASGLKERQFAEVFLKLRQKDPSILDKSAKFFTGEEEEENGEGVKTGAKPFLLKDEYQRAIQATEGKSEAEIDNAAPIADPSANLPLRTKERRMLSEQEAARKQRFLSAVNGNSGGNDDEEDTGLVLLATAPKKAVASSTLKEKEQNESTAKQLLSAAFRSSSQSKKSSSGKATKDEEEEANEAFLEKFFVQELWRDDANDDDDDEDGLKGGEVQRELTNWKDLAAAEQDEIFFDNAEQWERDYQNRQFRHEEGEDAFTVKTYPRAAGAEVTGTLRKQDTSRKDARARKEARREEMARRDVEELKRLKTLKKKEIDEQKRLIASIAGIKNSDKIPFTLEDLQKDFDPEEFDRKMKMMFDDDGEYDGEEDDDLNSDADDAQEAALLDALLGAEDEYADDGAEDTQSSADPTKKKKGVTKKLEKPTWDDELFKVASSAAAEDVDGTLFGDSLEETILNSKKFRAEGDPNKKTKKASKQSKRGGGSETAEDAGQLDAEYALLYPMEALKKLEEEAELENDEDDDEDEGSSDRKTDPSAKKKRTLSSLQEKLDKTVDEYFKLHYDKALDQGNLKTRFKYRTVPSCTFGLTDEDVLVKDDRELNMLSPMSNYASFLGKHENEVDERKALWRRRNIRTLSASRTSRKYGNVQNTMLFKVAEAAGSGEGGDADQAAKNDDGAVDEEQGAKIVERLRSRNQQLFSQQQTGSGAAARGGASFRPPPPRGDARGSKPFPQQHQQSFHRGGGGGDGRPYVAHGRGGRGGVQWGRGRGGPSVPGNSNNNNDNNKKRPRED